MVATRRRETTRPITVRFTDADLERLERLREAFGDASGVQALRRLVRNEAERLEKEARSTVKK